MSSSYSLKISSDNTSAKDISFIMSIFPTSVEFDWEYSIEENSDWYPNAINYLLDLVEDKIEELMNIGIKESDITLWFLYEYEGQCNMEFPPEDLKRIGQLGLTLCISCWEKDSTIEF